MFRAYSSQWMIIYLLPFDSYSTFIIPFAISTSLNWYVPANMESQIDNMYELEELDTITIGGAPLFNEPLRIMVAYRLVHSPKLSRFTLVVRPCLHARVLEENYLSVIERYIMELPRSSQQAQFEFSWLDN